MPDRPSNSQLTHAPGTAPVRDRSAEPAATGGTDERLNRLAGVIEAEIVPRLLLALSAACSTMAAPGRSQIPDAADVAELTRLLLTHDETLALAFIEMLQQQ